MIRSDGVAADTLICSWCCPHASNVSLFSRHGGIDSPAVPYLLQTSGTDHNPNLLVSCSDAGDFPDGVAALLATTLGLIHLQFPPAQRPPALIHHQILVMLCVDMLLTSEISRFFWTSALLCPRLWEC